MARKLTGLQRVLDVPSLAAVAYGEIASSIYFALGIIALYALGLTPWIVLAVGALFVLVSLSYAEGTAAFPETGGAATFVRRAFNDPAGFLTGWVLFLDYLIVIALAALFTPHYIGTAVGWEAVTEEPWDVVVGVGVIVGDRRAPAASPLAAVPHRDRPRRRRADDAPPARRPRLRVPAVPRRAVRRAIDLGTAPTWDALAFALPLGMLAYTGLETVANLAAEAREPSKTVPRSLFWGIGAVVVVSVAVAVVGISAYPAHRVPGRRVGDRARHAVAAGAARRHRRGLRRLDPERRWSRAEVVHRHHRSDRARRGRDDVDLRVSAASPTRSRGTRCCRTRSAGSAAEP